MRSLVIERRVQHMKPGVHFSKEREASKCTLCSWCMNNSRPLLWWPMTQLSCNDTKSNHTANTVHFSDAD